MHATDFVPGIVSLSITQIYLAPFNLTPRWLTPLHYPTTPSLLRRGRLGPGGPITRFGQSPGTRILEVDFLPEFQAVEWLGGGGDWWGSRSGASWIRQRARTHFHAHPLKPIHCNFEPHNTLSVIPAVSLRFDWSEKERERDLFISEERGWSRWREWRG